MFLILLLKLIITQTCSNWNLGVPGSTNAVMDDNDRRNLIVSGDETERNEYPWQVIFGGCNGALIASNWVITAAHCFDPDRYDFSPGRNDFQESFYFAHGSYERKSISIYLHPDYREEDAAVKNDIALVHIEPIGCSIPHISAVGLLDKGFDIDGCSSFVVGNGVLWEDGSQPEVSTFQEVQSRIHDITTCNEIATQNQQMLIDESQFCVFTPSDTSEDTCQGDSGAPLLIDSIAHNSTVQYVLSGITSYGYGCGHTPGTYSFIPYFKDWILSVFPEAPFINIQECDKNHYNEGPALSRDDNLPYTPSPVRNTEGYTTCQVVYASFNEYKRQCADPNCLICGPSEYFYDFGARTCIFCKEGYEVDLSGDISEGTPGAHCAGKCVPKGASTFTQTRAIEERACVAHPCLSGQTFIYDPPDIGHNGHIGHDLTIFFLLFFTIF